MKLKIVAPVLAALLYIPAFLFTVATESKELTPFQPTPVPKYALLVGVNEYKKQPGGISGLGGTHNDVALMKTLLAEKGFKEDGSAETKAAPCGAQAPQSAIKTLCSAQATKQAILDGFDNHLIKNAQQYWDGKGTIDPAKGPSIVFYYSGHGSHVSDKEPVPGEKREDLTIDEADGLDETLVPHDTDMDGTKDIRDDEFDKRIETLKKYTTNILFMADSCHSGTITRGAGKKGFERNIPGVSGDTRGGEQLSSDNIGSGSGYVTISGSLPTQFSYEDYLDDPVAPHKAQRNGLLTYYFVNFVRQNKNASYREIINLVRNATSAAGRDQTPQAEGDIDRGVFGETGPKVKSPIFIQCDAAKAERICSQAVTRKGEDGAEVTMHTVKLNVGTVIGARVGGPVIIYGPDAKDIDDKLGSGLIVAATKFTSEVEISLANGKTTVPENSKAVLVNPSFTDDKRTIAIDTTGSDEGAGRMRELAAQLKASAYVTPLESRDLLATLNANRIADPATARPPSGWDAAVVRGTYADYKLGRIMAPAKKGAVVPADNEQGYFITNRDGKPLYNFWLSASDPQAGAKLTRALEQHVRYENTKILGNEANDLASRVEVKLVKIKQFENGAPCTNTLASTEEQASIQQTPRLKAGDRFYFTVTNNTDKDLLIYILNLGTSGKISLLYPPGDSRETLAKGNSISTLGKDQCRHFYIPADEQYGSESIKIIATDTEIPAKLLTMDSIQLRTATKGSERGSNSPLARLLRQTATQTRDVSANEVAASGWATVNYEYEIVP